MPQSLVSRDHALDDAALGGRRGPDDLCQHRVQHRQEPIRRFKLTDVAGLMRRDQDAFRQLPLLPRQRRGGAQQGPEVGIPKADATREAFFELSQILHDNLQSQRSLMTELARLSILIVNFG